MNTATLTREVCRLYATTSRYVLSNLVCVRHAWGFESRPHKRRMVANRHRLPKMLGYRRDMVIKFKMDDLDLKRRIASGDCTPAEHREQIRKEGFLVPSDDKNEMPVYFSSLGETIDEYVPHESGSFTSVQKKAFYGVQKKGKSVLDTRKIRRFDVDFSASSFPTIAQDVYIKSHEALAEQRWDDLRQFATETCHALMIFGAERKTIFWRYLKSLEPPNVVQIRTQPMMEKSNLVGQVTVKFHSQQILAVYDRFGRLMHGSPTVAKDVLEYVVFEKHLPNPYGLWRLHKKIVPAWIDREPRLSTHVMDNSQDFDDGEGKATDGATVKSGDVERSKISADGPSSSI